MLIIVYYLNIYSSLPLSLSDSCNSGCDCSRADFDPICGSDQIMYYSPCHAGCTQEDSLRDIKVIHFIWFSIVVRVNNDILRIILLENNDEVELYNDRSCLKKSNILLLYTGVFSMSLYNWKWKPHHARSGIKTIWCWKCNLWFYMPSFTIICRIDGLCNVFHIFIYDASIISNASVS